MIDKILERKAKKVQKGSSLMLTGWQNQISQSRQNITEEKQIKSIFMNS